MITYALIGLFVSWFAVELVAAIRHRPAPDTRPRLCLKCQGNMAEHPRPSAVPAYNYAPMHLANSTNALNALGLGGAGLGALGGLFAGISAQSAQAAEMSQRQAIDRQRAMLESLLQTNRKTASIIEDIT